MGVIDDQAEVNREAWRRSNPYGEIPPGAPPQAIPANAGLNIGDTWSSGVAMPGVETPDLQGPTKPLHYPDTAGGGFSEGNHNTEDIIRNPHGRR
jgi:hypothetical protein